MEKSWELKKGEGHEAYHTIISIRSGYYHPGFLPDSSESGFG
jgi:hypothetical protein